MIIQCDHCSAKFRMDDSKLANGPVRVRCAKCKEVFVVRKDEDPEESFQLPTDFEATSTTSTQAGFGQGAVSASEGFSSGAGEFSFNMDESSFGESVVTTATSGEKEASDEFDWQNASNYSDSSSGVDTTAGRASAEQSEITASGEFDFGDTSQTETSFVAPVHVPSGVEAPQDDFAIDFGEVTFSDTPSSETAASTDFVFAPDDTASKGKHTDMSDGFPATSDAVGDFGVSFDSNLSEKDAKSPALESAADNAPFGDFDFGEIEEQHVKQSEPSFPMPDAFLGGRVSSEEFAPLSQQEDEVPPSSLTTRKKRGSLFPIFVIIGAIMLLVALVGSGAYFFGGPKVFSKVGLGFLVEWYGQKGGEEGDIVIRNVKAEYVVSKEAGELFIVRGEAFNNYKKPRSSIQVKVALLGSGGSSIKAKTAFCGNPLSNEQLASLPFAKIEDVMNNQFGDSLANLGVKPGNAIPFVVVINDIPKEASDYSVQVSGSTVATQ